MLNLIKKLPPGLYNMVGQSATAGWQWVMTIWLMRIFGPEELGRYTYVLAVVSPLLLFSNFQLRNRLAAQPGLLTRTKTYLHLRSFTVFLSLVISFVWIWFSGKEISWALLMGILAFKAIESASELMHGILQAEGKLVRVGLSLVIKGVIALFMMALVYVSHWEVWTFFALLAVGHALVMMSFETMASQTLKNGDLPPAQSLVKAFGEDPHLFSLGLMAWLTSLNANWPRYFIENHHGWAALGNFSAIFAIYAVLGVLLNAWLQGALSKLAQVATQPKLRDRVVSRLAMQIVLYHVVAGLVFIPFGDFLLEMMFGKNLNLGWENALLLIVLSFTAGMSTLMYYFLLACQRMSGQWLVMLMANVFTVSVGGWLIPQMAIAGALASLLAGTIWQLACYAVMSHQLLSKEEEA